MPFTFASGATFVWNLRHTKRKSSHGAPRRPVERHLRDVPSAPFGFSFSGFLFSVQLPVVAAVYGQRERFRPEVSSVGLDLWTTYVGTDYRVRDNKLPVSTQMHVCMCGETAVSVRIRRKDRDELNCYAGTIHFTLTLPMSCENGRACVFHLLSLSRLTYRNRGVHTVCSQCSAPCTNRTKGDKANRLRRQISEPKNINSHNERVLIKISQKIEFQSQDPIPLKVMCTLLFRYA